MNAPEKPVALARAAHRKPPGPSATSHGCTHKGSKSERSRDGSGKLFVIAEIQAMVKGADLDTRRQSRSEPTRLNTDRRGSVRNVAHRHCKTSPGRRGPLGAAVSA